MSASTDGFVDLSGAVAKIEAERKAKQIAAAKKAAAPKPSTKPPAKPGTTNPRNLGLSIMDKVQEFRIPEAPSDESTNMDVYGRAWEELCQLDPGFGALTRAQSEHYWLQGALLNHLYHVVPSKRRVQSLLTQEQYGEFKSKYLKNVSNDTLEDRRHVADKFGRFEARSKCYSDMVADCKMERAAARKTKPGKTNGKPPTPKVKKPIRISKVEDKFKTVETQLEHLLTLPKAPDRLDNPQEALEILDGLKANLRTIENWLKKFEVQRQQLRREIEKALKKTQFVKTPKAPKAKK